MRPPSLAAQATPGRAGCREAANVSGPRQSVLWSYLNIFLNIRFNAGLGAPYKVLSADALHAVLPTVPLSCGVAFFQGSSLEALAGWLALPPPSASPSSFPPPH